MNVCGIFSIFFVQTITFSRHFHDNNNNKLFHLNSIHMRGEILRSEYDAFSRFKSHSTQRVKNSYLMQYHVIWRRERDLLAWHFFLRWTRERVSSSLRHVSWVTSRHKKIASNKRDDLWWYFVAVVLSEELFYILNFCRFSFFFPGISFFVRSFYAFYTHHIIIMLLGVEKTRKNMKENTKRTNEKM